MIYIQNTVPEKYTMSMPSQLRDFSDLLFIDLETTGFSPLKDTITVLGAMSIKNSQSIIHQWFIESTTDEKEALVALSELLTTPYLIITYNGKSFDIPFLNKKAAHYHMTWSIPSGSVIDLMHWAKKGLPTLNGYGLKNVEIALGIERTDEISGKECVDLYHEYLIDGNTDKAQLIIKHNEEDILHMAPLTELMKFIPDTLHASLIPEPLTINNHIYWADGIKPSKNYILLSGKSTFPFEQPVHWHNGGFSLELKDHHFTLTLPIFQLDYPNPDSFFLAFEQIPDYSLLSFNDLSLNEKLELLIYDGQKLYTHNIVKIIRHALR